MKINFTKKEYRRLLDLLQIAEWVLHAHTTDVPDDTKPYRELEQKLLSYAKEMGCKHLITYESKLDGYYPTREYEDTSPYMEYIEAFEHDSFWEELIQRLSDRDFVQQEGKAKIRRMSAVERMEKRFVFEEYYRNEFGQYGITRLAIQGDLSSSMIRDEETTESNDAREEEYDKNDDTRPETSCKT